MFCLKREGRACAGGGGRKRVEQTERDGET